MVTQFGVEPFKDLQPLIGAFKLQNLKTFFCPEDGLLQHCPEEMWCHITSGQRYNPALFHYLYELVSGFAEEIAQGRVNESAGAHDLGGDFPPLFRSEKFAQKTFFYPPDLIGDVARMKQDMPFGIRNFSQHRPG